MPNNYKKYLLFLINFSIEFGSDIFKFIENVLNPLFSYGIFGVYANFFVYYSYASSVGN